MCRMQLTTELEELQQLLFQQKQQVASLTAQNSLMQSELDSSKNRLQGEVERSSLAQEQLSAERQLRAQKAEQVRTTSCLQPMPHPALQGRLATTQSGLSLGLIPHCKAGRLLQYTVVSARHVQLDRWAAPLRQLRRCMHQPSHIKDSVGARMQACRQNANA